MDHPKALLSVARDDEVFTHLVLVATERWIQRRGDGCAVARRDLDLPSKDVLIVDVPVSVHHSQPLDLSCRRILSVYFARTGS